MKKTSHETILFNKERTVNKNLISNKTKTTNVNILASFFSIFAIYLII